MFTPAFLAYAIVMSVITVSIVFRSRPNRWVRLVQGVVIQMIVVIPIAIAQLTGFVWKSWSIDTGEALEVFPLSMLFDMAGWTVITPFGWLVPTRQTWVMSNLSEFGVLWVTKVMIVAMVIAWRREQRTSMYDWFIILIMIGLFVDAWITRDFPWWGS